MRLWHYRIVPALPNSQLVAQWRELNSIFTKRPNHILINYVYASDKVDVHYYSLIVINELKKRGYNVHLEHLMGFCTGLTREQLEITPENNPDFVPFKGIHTPEYATICYYNLLEKFRRGQKDFSSAEMNRIYEITKKENQE